MTLFKVFGEFLALDCEYNTNFLKGYLLLYNDMNLQNTTFNDTKCND